MDGISASGGSEKLLFEAVVRPRRSLSVRALWGVIGAMLAGALVVTGEMVLLGAWPVIVCDGVVMALAAGLLGLHMRAARARETIRLSATRLTVTRVDAGGRHEEVVLAPYWLNVVLEERAGTVPRCLLVARGRSLEVGQALGEAEKRDLAAALARALRRGRHPRFDNPQTRG